MLEKKVLKIEMFILKGTGSCAHIFICVLRLAVLSIVTPRKYFFLLKFSSIHTAQAMLVRYFPMKAILIDL